MPIQGKPGGAEAHQPPLYYLIAAIPASLSNLKDIRGSFTANPNYLYPNQNRGLHGSADTFPYLGQVKTLHFARFGSIVLGAGSVLLILVLGWELFPETLGIGLLAALLMLLTPQFLFISTVLNNDNLLILAASAAWLQSYRTLKEPDKWKNWWLLGFTAALAFLAKLTGISVLITVILLLIFISITRRSWAFLGKGLLALIVSVFVLASPWFLYNQIVYKDPLGWNVYTQIYSHTQRDLPLTFGQIGDFWRIQFESFWATFGWMVVRAPDWFYIAARVLLLLSLAGFAVAWLKGRLRELNTLQRHFMVYLGFSILLVLEGILIVKFDPMHGILLPRSIFITSNWSNYVVNWIWIMEPHSQVECCNKCNSCIRNAHRKYFITQSSHPSDL